MDKEAQEKIARKLYYGDGSTASSNLDYIPKWNEVPTVIKDVLRKQADQIHKIYEELGYRKPPEEQAEMVGWLINRGWIPPEEAQNYILKPPERPEGGLPKKERHLITIYPDMRFGEPTIDHHRITAEQMASAWWAGNYTVKETEGNWTGINRGAVLVSCWYMARYGSRTWRKRWKEWLEIAEGELWNGKYETCPMPPQSGSPKG